MSNLQNNEIAEREGITRQAAWLRTPKRKAYVKAYRQTPKSKAYQKAYQKTYCLRKKKEKL